MINFEKERSGKLYIHHQFCEYLSESTNIHNSYEFVHIYDGLYIITVNKKKYELKANESLLILPGQIHSFETIIPSNSSPKSKTLPKPFLCIFSPDNVKNFFEYTANSELVSPVFKLTNTNLIDDFVKTDNLFIKQSFLYLICGLSMTKGITKNSAIEDSDLFYKIVNQISEKFMGTLTLKQMAKDLGYNYTYLSTFFNNHLGGFSSFINEYRIEYAKKLLRDTSLSMSQIAVECGFYTIRNFNRAFLQKENISPSDYKQSKVSNR